LINFASEVTTHKLPDFGDGVEAVEMIYDAIGNLLKKKNFDLVVLNSTKEKGAGFQLDTNNVQVFNSSGISVKSGVAPKNEIAHFILDQIKLLSI
jgi:phosphopantothenoylcysteine synthetase/decarboxylase